jgi:hypothetical protein
MSTFCSKHLEVWNKYIAKVCIKLVINQNYVLLYIVLSVLALQKVVFRHYKVICMKNASVLQDTKQSVRWSFIITFVLWEDGNQYSD